MGGFLLNDLYHRGLSGDGVELIATDGGQGLLAALPLVYPRIPHQRCWAHKVRNILNSVRRADHETVKNDLHRISHAPNRRQAQKALGRFQHRWQDCYPKAVRSLRADTEELLAFFQVQDPSLWPQVRTTNAIERRFREVRRRTRPMGTFSDRTGMERILFAVFTHENLKQATSAPFPTLAQNS